MKQAEILESTTAKLQEKLVESKKAHTDLKMAHAISPLDNPMQLRVQRRSIARIQTELIKRDVQ
jgi:large subunit ribosomal protein L29